MTTAVQALVPFRAPEPRIPAGASAVLRELALAAVAGVNRAWSRYDRAGLVAEVTVGADGTPTYRIDALVEEAIVAATRPHAVNLLSEKLGFLDGGHAATVVLDPLDGSANAAAGVPLSCFSAALVVDGVAQEALSVCLETGHAVWARAGEPVPYRTSGCTDLGAAAVDMLRPKVHAAGDSTEAWVLVSRAVSRVRVLSTTCLEAMLVAEGSIDGFLDPGSDTHRIVDLAAAMLFVPAAGGAFIDLHGRPLEFDTDLTRRWSGIVAATQRLAESLAEAALAGEDTRVLNH